jgi:ABC-type uncharacterized transport system permease subunit
VNAPIRLASWLADGLGPLLRTRRSAGWVVAAGSVVATVLVVSASLALGGHDPVPALTALVSGAFGSSDRLLSITLVRSVPLILAGLAVALAFRAGVWNIGAEGQLYAGATILTATALWLPGLPGLVGIPFFLLLACLAGAAWAVVPALLKVRSGTNEVITTLLMNFVAIYMSAYLVHGPLQESRGVFPQSDAIGQAARLPIVVPGTRLHLGFLLALLLAGVLWVVLTRTAFGFRIRAVGASPRAARISGRIRSDRVIVATLLLSGAIAGLAGGVEVAGVTFALYEGLSPGYGYTAIAVALLGGLRPGGVVLAGIFFGALQGGASAMQREAGIPAVWVNGIEAVVILAVVAMDRVLKETRALQQAEAGGSPATPAVEAAR